MSAPERKAGSEKERIHHCIVWEISGQTSYLIKKLTFHGPVWKRSEQDIKTEEGNDAQRLLRNSADKESKASQTPGPSIHTEDSGRYRELVKDRCPPASGRPNNGLYLDALKIKLEDPMRRVQLKKLEWVIITSGVLVACIAGTVVSHGLAAPVFVLVPMAWKMAENEIHTAEVEAGVRAKKNKEAAEQPQS